MYVSTVIIDIINDVCNVSIISLDILTLYTKNFLNIFNIYSNSNNINDVIICIGNINDNGIPFVSLLFNISLLVFQYFGYISDI